LVTAYLEYTAVKRRRGGADGHSGKCVLGNTDEDDSVDLLQSDRAAIKLESDASLGATEVQLQPLKG
jgi:hypothetical protein